MIAFMQIPQNKDNKIILIINTLRNDYLHRNHYRYHNDNHIKIYENYGKILFLGF